MNPDKYFEIYNSLVIGKGVDPDEAECIMSDLEDEMKLECNRGIDAYELLDGMGY